jgi:hypothetical protein
MRAARARLRASAGVITPIFSPDEPMTSTLAKSSLLRVRRLFREDGAEDSATVEVDVDAIAAPSVRYQLSRW